MELVRFKPQHPDIATLYALSKSNGTMTNQRNIKARRSVAAKFLRWLGKPIGEVNHQDVMLWRAEQEAKGLSHATIYQRLSIVSTLFEFAIANGLASHNPVAGLGSEWRKTTRPRPYSSEKVKALSPQEVQTFLAAIDRSTVQGARLYAMVLTMLHTGMRASEVCNILWKNTNLNNGVPTVRTRVKGGDFVTFELIEEVADSIRAYLRIAKRRPRRPHALFAPVVKRRRNGQLYPPMRSYYLWTQVKAVAKRVGIEMTTHTFRHTFAQLFHNAGASQPEVQGALGHKNAATTRVYLGKLAPRSRKAGLAVQKVLAEAS